MSIRTLLEFDSIAPIRRYIACSVLGLMLKDTIFMWNCTSPNELKHLFKKILTDILFVHVSIFVRTLGPIEID